MKLRAVKYQCNNCRRTFTLRFAPDYLPRRAMQMTCVLCRKYGLVRALGRLITGRWAE